MAYKGLQKQFIVKKLTPLTLYALRVQAENGIGASAWSAPALIYTAGCVPETPPSPQLLDATSTSLTLGGWHLASVAASKSKTSTTTVATTPTMAEISLDYELQMHAIEDALTSAHGFITVANGPLDSYEVRELRRATAYLFRVRAKNDEGHSSWSEVAKFLTRPDVPRAPLKLKVERVALKNNPAIVNQYRVQWETPRDDGGSPVLFYSLELALASSPSSPLSYECVYTGPNCEFAISNSMTITTVSSTSTPPRSSSNKP